MWTLNEAVEFIRGLQPKLKEAGWYASLAGGVLNNGSSDHDVDLVVLPLDSSRYTKERLVYALREHGLTRVQDAQATHHYWRMRGIMDEKAVEVWRTHDERRVDIITGSYL